MYHLLVFKPMYVQLVNLRRSNVCMHVVVYKQIRTLSELIPDMILTEKMGGGLANKYR